MSDSKKLDLNADFDGGHDDLLRNVQAATEQVKQRQAADKAKEAADARAAKSRTMSAVLIAVGVVVIFLLSYWIVFGRQGGDGATGSGGAASSVTAQEANGKAQPPCVDCAPTTTPPQAVTPPAANNSQNVAHPPDGYEQPTDDPGM